MILPPYILTSLHFPTGSPKFVKRQLQKIHVFHLLFSDLFWCFLSSYDLWLYLRESLLFKYLGVLVKNNLSWTQHIHVFTPKQNEPLGSSIYRHFSRNSPTLYLNLTHPLLDFGATIHWIHFCVMGPDLKFSLGPFTLEPVSMRIEFALIRCALNRVHTEVTGVSQS